MGEFVCLCYKWVWLVKNCLFCLCGFDSHYGIGKNIYFLLLCLHSAFFARTKQLDSSISLAWVHLFLLLVVVVVILRVRVWVCVCVCSQHCCWLFGLSCFSIDILWKNLSCPELLFPSFLCLSYVCGCCCCCCVCICLLVYLFLSAQWEQLILPN